MIKGDELDFITFYCRLISTSPHGSGGNAKGVA